MHTHTTDMCACLCYCAGIRWKWLMEHCEEYTSAFTAPAQPSLPEQGMESPSNLSPSDFDSPRGAPQAPGDEGARFSKTDRTMWKPEDDAIILENVAKYGHKWSQLAILLPGRSAHAIRNRYHRLGARRHSTSDTGQLPSAPGISQSDCEAAETSYSRPYWQPLHMHSAPGPPQLVRHFSCGDSTFGVFLPACDPPTLATHHSI